MAIISNGVTVISNGAGSAPTTAQVLSATASASAGAVGSYIMGWEGVANFSSPGYTSPYVEYSDSTGSQGGSAPGTWRQMGVRPAGNTGQRCTVWLRIS